MKKLLLVLLIALANQVQAQNYCDSIEISMNYPPNSFAEFSVNLVALGFSGVTYDWILTDESGTVISTAATATATFSLPNAMNSDTNYICLTSTFSSPAMTFACQNICDTIVWDGTNWMLLSMMMLPPCNLTGASVSIDNSSNPRIMNVNINGMSTYSYSWNNGSTTNYTPFYTQWCVTISDNITGCDTTICQDCIADANAMCMCIMIYMPVCGCDGVMYSNSCLADCADVSWTPAISNGMPGGFLPCNQSSVCEVEISGDSIICSSGTPQVLTAVPSGNGTPPYTYSWSNGQSNSSILTIINSGTYCVTLTDANGCIATECIDVSVQDIPIYSAPAPPIICYGDSIVLEIDTSSFLYNITWIPNTIVAPPFHRIVDFPIFSQTYIVEGIDSVGCDRRGEIFVTVDSCSISPCAVEINNGTVDVEICSGDTVILEATTGFDSYLWTLASVGSSLGTTHFVQVLNPGIYIVIATDIINNCIDMDSIEVVFYPETPLNPMTAPNPPMVCLGDSVVIEVNSGFLNYWWNTGNPLDQDEDRVVIFPVQDFTYVVEALDANGCESREEIEVFVDTCATGIINIMSSQVIIFPNPSKSIMTIQMPKSEIFDLVIFDVMGRVVLSENKVNQTYIIADNTLANGSYILNLSHNKGIISKKLLIE